jgi:hypothetical protein
MKCMSRVVENPVRRETIYLRIIAQSDLSREAVVVVGAEGRVVVGHQMETAYQIVQVRQICYSSLERIAVSNRNCSVLLLDFAPKFAVQVLIKLRIHTLG